MDEMSWNFNIGPLYFGIPKMAQEAGFKIDEEQKEENDEGPVVANGQGLSKLDHADFLDEAGGMDTQDFDQFHFQKGV
jgi:hypothetical protein